MTSGVRVAGHAIATLVPWHYAGTKPSAFRWMCQCGAAGVARTKAVCRSDHREHKITVRNLRLAGRRDPTPTETP